MYSDIYIEMSSTFTKLKIPIGSGFGGGEEVWVLQIKSIDNNFLTGFSSSVLISSCQRDIGEFSVICF